MSTSKKATGRPYETYAPPAAPIGGEHRFETYRAPKPQVPVSLVVLGAAALVLVARALRRRS